MIIESFCAPKYAIKKEKGSPQHDKKYLQITNLVMNLSAEHVRTVVLASGVGNTVITHSERLINLFGIIHMVRVKASLNTSLSGPGG